MSDKLNEKLALMADVDMDQRYMAASDICKIVMTTNVDTNSQRKITQAFLKHLKDTMTNIQAHAVKCITQCLPFLDDSSAREVLSALAKNLSDTSSGARDINSTCIIGLLPHLPSRLLSPFLTTILPTLDEMLTHSTDSIIRRDAANVLGEVAAHFPAAPPVIEFAPRISPAVISIICESPTSPTGKKALSCFGALVPILDQVYLLNVCSQSVVDVRSAAPLPRVGILSVLATICRVAGARVTERIPDIAPCFVGLLSEVSEEDEEVDKSCTALVEQALVALETLLQAQSAQVSAGHSYLAGDEFLKGVTGKLPLLLKYDPYRFDDFEGSQTVSMGAGSDDEFSFSDDDNDEATLMFKDDGGISTDDDDSWRVRKASASFLASLLSLLPSCHQRVYEQFVSLSLVRLQKETMDVVVSAVARLGAAIIRANPATNGDKFVAAAMSRLQAANATATVREAILVDLLQAVAPVASRALVSPASLEVLDDLVSTHIGEDCDACQLSPSETKIALLALVTTLAVSKEANSAFGAHVKRTPDVLDAVIKALKIAAPASTSALVHRILFALLSAAQALGVIVVGLGMHEKLTVLLPALAAVLTAPSAGVSNDARLMATTAISEIMRLTSTEVEPAVMASAASSVLAALAARTASNAANASERALKASAKIFAALNKEQLAACIDVSVDPVNKLVAAAVKALKEAERAVVVSGLALLGSLLEKLMLNSSGRSSSSAFASLYAVDQSVPAPMVAVASSAVKAILLHAQQFEKLTTLNGQLTATVSVDATVVALALKVVALALTLRQAYSLAECDVARFVTAVLTSALSISTLTVQVAPSLAVATADAVTASIPLATEFEADSLVKAIFEGKPLVNAATAGAVVARIMTAAKWGDDKFRVFTDAAAKGAPMAIQAVSVAAALPNNSASLDSVVATLSTLLANEVQDSAEAAADALAFQIASHPENEAAAAAVTRNPPSELALLRQLQVIKISTLSSVSSSKVEAFAKRFEASFVPFLLESTKIDSEKARALIADTIGAAIASEIALSSSLSGVISGMLADAAGNPVAAAAAASAARVAVLTISSNMNARGYRSLRPRKTDGDIEELSVVSLHDDMQDTVSLVHSLISSAIIATQSLANRTELPALAVRRETYHAIRGALNGPEALKALPLVEPHVPSLLTLLATDVAPITSLRSQTDMGAFKLISDLSMPLRKAALHLLTTLLTTLASSPHLPTLVDVLLTALTSTLKLTDPEPINLGITSVSRLGEAATRHPQLAGELAALLFSDERGLITQLGELYKKQSADVDGVNEKIAKGESVADGDNISKILNHHAGALKSLVAAFPQVSYSVGTFVTPLKAGKTAFDSA